MASATTLRSHERFQCRVGTLRLRSAEFGTSSRSDRCGEVIVVVAAVERKIPDRDLRELHASMARGVRARRRAYG